jgi:hypothetical protein
MLKRIVLSFVAVLCSLALVATISGCSNQPTSFGLPSQQDSFSGKVFYNNKVDILFVVDNSKSMLQYQQRLASQMQAMISTLNSLKMDYRVAVATSTMSSDTSSYPLTRKLVGSPVYLTASNINLLTERIIVGESGSDLERSLDSMRLVTSTSYLSSIGSDFIRSDALFSVIFISDERDQSSEFGNPNTNDFVNYLNSRKPDFETGGKAWLANYIGILTNQSCDILGGSVSIGTQFLNLVTASGGVKSSICNADLSAAVSNIKARIIDQITAYRFNVAPNKASIIVTVGSRAIFEDALNGWTLEDESITGVKKYFLKFHGSSIPAADENVDVKFTPATAT